MWVDVTYLTGVKRPKAEPIIPFAPSVLGFLEAFSLELYKRRGDLIPYPEIKAFGFWIRRTHMEEFQLRYADGRIRIGRGVIFHMAAANVPLLFAYSTVIGLLAGNSCAVRISSRSQEQDRKLCEIMDHLLKRREFTFVRDRISIFSCDRENEVVRDWVKECDGLMVWGGDKAIQSVRRMDLRPDVVQVMFPDRYSICILDLESVGKMQEEELSKLAYSFVKDTYAMDQNACSSPRFIIWNQKEMLKKAEIIRRKWWKAVEKEAASYDLSPHKATKKYEALCRYAMTMEGIVTIEQYKNLVYTVLLSDIPSNPEQYRGTWGLFFEYQGDYGSALEKLAVRQLQTVTYYGILRKELIDYVVNHHLYGVHRVVPVGDAMNMDLIWDGQDMIRMLSREISREE
jgi:hypothetical protein